MKVVGLVSGGKDSCYAMMRCIDYGHEIIALANLLPLDDSVDELDSYMYQTVGHQIVISYSECMGLPLFRRRIRGFMRHHHLSYAVTPGDEVEDLFILLNEIKQQIPSITAVSSGAIASDYQRLRVENVCTRLGLVSLAYLWKQDQTILLEEMIRKGIVAITVKVAAMGLNPANHLGKELADLQTQLLQMNELYGINVCGEGGEYETLTLDCPLFTNSRIVLDSSQVILQSFDSIAPVGILHPLNFHLEHKKEILPSNSHSEDIDIGSEGIGRIYEVHGDFVQNYMGNCQSASLASDFHSSKKLNLSFSTNKRDTFSIGCWVQFSSGTSEGLEEDMMAVLRRIESQLSERGFGWVNVLYIHLYISNMKQFALANEVYVRFITEKKCYLGVPSRSTIELPLMQVGLGNAYIEVLVSNDQKKRVLHVQSISCWAPSCIGPYSQATLHKEVLYMAGQLGLDPPTMMLCPGGPAAEMEQALKNCEAVANSFNSSLASHAIIIVIYCSAALTCCGRGEIQSRMESFVRDKVDLSLKLLDPIFLYVLAPNLPKGALVEVKPLLHIAENGEDGVEPVVPETSSKLVADFWSCEVSELYESCSQICNTRGMICTALVSMTKDLAATICSGVDGKIPTSMEYSCEQWKAIAKGCIYFIDRVLCANGFSWGDLEYLRFYFTTDLSVTSDVLFLVFSEAFNESVGIARKSEAWFEVEPIFNLIPVLSSGRSASMGDLISCELLASKL